MNEKNHEIEVRALVADHHVESVITRLQAMQAVDKGEAQLLDIYYCPKSTQSFDELELREIGSYALRIRQKVKADQTVVELNVKKITAYNDHNAWEEQEVKINSLPEMQKILDTLGFRPFFILDKTRHTFVLGEFTICLENIQDFGHAVEIEVIGSRDEAERVQVRIHALLTDLGLSADLNGEKSITNMLMRQKSDFRQAA